MYCREFSEHSTLPSGSFPATTASSPNLIPGNENLSHLYHSKYFINSFVSHTSTSFPAQTLSFDRHPLFAGGRVGYQPRQQRIYSLAPRGADGLGRPALPFTPLSHAWDFNRPTISSLHRYLSSINCKPLQSELLNLTFHSASAFASPLSSFFPPATSHSSPVTVPLSPLASSRLPRAHAKGANHFSRNPLYLPLLRKNRGVGAVPISPTASLRDTSHLPPPLPATPHSPFLIPI